MMNTSLLFKVQVFIILEMKKNGLKENNKKKWHGPSGGKFWQNFDYWKDEEKLDQLGVPCKRPGEQQMKMTRSKAEVMRQR